MTFEEELEREFIPAIIRMIEKETEHLAMLKNSKEKYQKKILFPFTVAVDFNRMIDVSEKHLKHLEIRLKEYGDYVDNCKNKAALKMLSIDEALNGDANFINNQISIRLKLLDSLVGTLYPSIVWDEIIHLRKKYSEITGKFDYL